ncbi:hypothetical protein OHT76_33340 [Streptomyces sp. NBC_00287]|uniref:hypothetical protein n=1 Tax=Streptomyces sp. NBC_00287 TaxID=2975702 RepID=UPI002E2D7410|nr:hypothetical protein [Streptomyces sp. NBC_00287]
MAGREFGHHLGLPQALSGLPLAPLVPGYAELAAAQHAAGLRHLGEALAPDGGLRVLDGLYVPAGRGRRRVDGHLLDELARSGASVARLLAALHRRDPQAPRRVVLYQLICLLQDGPGTVQDLGVHPDETAGLLAASRHRATLDRRQRDAAESLADAWQHRRMHRARALLERLPKGDPEVERLRLALAARAAAVDTALTAARRAEGRGGTDTASDHYLLALDLAADDRRALRGLVRVHRPEQAAFLRTELSSNGVELTWERADTDWRLLCLYRTEDGAARVREVPERQDTAVPLGTTVRYAALPLENGRVTGPPLVSHRVLYAPEVTGLTLTDGPERIRGTWRKPPGAEEVTVDRTGPDGTTVRVEARTDSFTAAGLPVGRHTFRVVCHYRAPDGQLVPSPGVAATHTVHPWPEPVRTLTATPEGDTVRFDWTGGGQEAEVRLVVWPGRVPPPATELRTAELPPAILVPPAGHTRVAAVAVLGDRALAGPTVDVEVLPPVTGLTARRLPHGAALVSLDWPDGTSHLTVVWDGPDGGGERTVTAHAYRRGGLRLPVGPRGVRIRAAVVPQVPGAVVVAAAGAETALPPDTSIGYQLVRHRRRFKGGSRTLLRVTLSAPAEEYGPDVPEFVCVARSGTLRPRSATDGTTVLRIPGADLTRHGTVEQELPAAPCPVPYTLRGFLLGEYAAAVRLEEPSPATLVVR